MSLKDILGFDPAVQCHPLSSWFCLVFFSTSAPVSLHSSALLPSLRSSRFSLSSLSPRCRFYVCLVDGGRKRSRKFICRDVAPYSKTRMIYLHGAEGETREMDLLGKGLSSVTRKGENAKCIFWMERANPLSKPLAEVRPQFLCLSIPWILVGSGFSYGEKRTGRARMDFERDLLRCSTDLG